MTKITNTNSMKWTNNNMSKFNISKMIKTILRVSAGVLQLAVTLFFVIGLFSAATVVLNYADSISTETAVLNYGDTTNVSLSIPFYFNNSGLYDIDDLTLTIDLNIHNLTDDFDVLNGSEQFTVEAGNYINTTLVFDNGVLDPDLFAGLALNATSYNMTLYAGISGRYLYSLVPFGFSVNAEIPLSFEP